MTYGSRAVKSGGPAGLVACELEEGRRERFSELDAFIDRILIRSLHAERVTEFTTNALGEHWVSVTNVTDAERAFINGMFSAEQQEKRGALFLPEKTRILSGLINLPSIHAECERFAMGVVQEEAGQVLLKSSSDAVLAWSVLVPLFETFFTPFILRTQLSGKRTHDQTLSMWERVDEVMRLMAFDLSEELHVFRYGGGWHHLNAEGQIGARRRVLSALADQARPGMAAGYRCLRVWELATQYYTRAKKGSPTRKRVLTKGTEATLSGYFGGDWLAFLDYLGEEPQSDEVVVTALPTPQIYVTGSDRVAEVADSVNLPVEEVRRMVAALWGETVIASPIEQRVSVLRKYWECFDFLHARQEPGMEPLWGLVDEGWVGVQDTGENSPYNHQVYRKLLPAELVHEIEKLWGVEMLPRYPERIVTALYPHQRMAETFGPALDFWHGCALTAWFICEGPTSRTDLQGIAHYHRRELAALKDYGTPVNEGLFSDLIAAERRLGTPQPIERVDHRSNVGGLTITMSTSYGTRRKGFAILRDIITQHRREWSEKHLETYLRSRWETALTDTWKVFQVALHGKGKPLTLKQFAKKTSEVTNCWFGGDIGKLYTALGERSPATPIRNRIMPLDVNSFLDRLERMLDTDIYYPRSMGNTALECVQLLEALGRPPTLNEYGTSRFRDRTYLYKYEHLNAEDEWMKFLAAVQEAMEETQEVSNAGNKVIVASEIAHSNQEESGKHSAVELLPPRTESNTDSTDERSQAEQTAPRMDKGLCISCGRKLGILDKFIGRDHHKHCPTL